MEIIPGLAPLLISAFVGLAAWAVRGLFAKLNRLGDDMILIKTLLIGPTGENGIRSDVRSNTSAIDTLQTRLDKAGSIEPEAEPYDGRLQEHGGDYSFTKLLIIYFCVTPWFGVTFAVATMIILISAAFGKSTWESYLQRGTWSTSDTTTTETKNITERRIVDGPIGFEPA